VLQVRPLLLITLGLALAMGACQEKDFDLASPENSFVIAKKPYTQGNYEIALTKLGEFKTRFPYSSFATEAELMIADSYYALGRYAEAVVSYEHFIKLHPKHEKVAFAQFRIGQSYWLQAPTEIDREQDLSARAVAEWEKLLSLYPQSEYVGEATNLSMQGKRRIAESYEFIAKFYCKQDIWHACAHRSLALAENYAKIFPDLGKRALLQGALAFGKLADTKVDAENEKRSKESNLYFKAMSRDELRQRAEELREQAAKL
jgi:outer membrane protein assembly factor BamD